MTNRFEEKRASSKSLILDTALQLFATHGFDKTSIRMIAEAAGISLGLLYNYFKSKDELLAEIFTKSAEDIHASFTDTGEESASQTGIERHVRQTIKILKEKKDFWKLLHSIRMQSPVVQRLLSETKAQTAYIEEQIKQNMMEIGIPNPELEAKLFFATIDGLANHFLLHQDYPIDDMATLLISKYEIK